MAIRAPIIGLTLLFSALSLGCSGPGATRHDPARSTFESDPAGASIFVDGGFVGRTPTAFFLPAKEQVEIRILHPDCLPLEEVLYRAKVAEGSGEGLGWDPTYFYPLNPKRN